MTTTQLVRVRSPPSLHCELLPSSRIIENVASGKVTLLEDRGTWVRVRTSSGEGRIQRDDVSVP